MDLFNHRIAFFSISLLLVGITAYRVYERHYCPDAELVFFDVGQGESVLLRLPFGRVYLVDAGSSTYPRRVGSEIFRELSRKGILHLDGLVISHPDLDHVGGVSDLFRHLSVAKLFYPSALDRELALVPKLLDQLKAEARSRKTEVVPVIEREISQSGSFRLVHLSFIPPKKKTSNNLSLVSLLEVYGCRILLTGDIEKETEQEAQKKIRKPIHVLKVAHHGSKTSSQRRFLKALLPFYAVVSVGSQNRYGHPTSEVLNRFRFLRTTVFRTDFHGFTSFRIKPSGEMVCENALGPCGRIYCQS